MSMDSNRSTSVVDLTTASSGPVFVDVLTAARGNEHRRLFASAMRACAAVRTGDHNKVSARAITATIEALLTRIFTTISHPVWVPLLDSPVGVVKNQPVARRGLATVLAVAVQVSAVTAPMAHVHLDDHETAHHHAREMHTHLASHGAPATRPIDPHVPSLSDDDGDERVLSVSGFVATNVDSFPGVTAIPVETAIVIPDEVTISRIPVVSHGHDPPSLSATPSRAPPSSPAC